LSIITTYNMRKKTKPHIIFLQSYDNFNHRFKKINEISQVPMWKSTNIPTYAKFVYRYHITTHAVVVIIANAIKIWTDFAKQSVFVQRVSKIKKEFQTRQVIIIWYFASIDNKRIEINGNAITFILLNIHCIGISWCI